LDKLVEYEVKRNQIQARAEAKLAKQEERAAEQLKRKEAKEKAWRDALREQELKRLAKEKEEEAKIKETEKVCTLLHCVSGQSVAIFAVECSYLLQHAMLVLCSQFNLDKELRDTSVMFYESVGAIHESVSLPSRLASAL
jgi:DNA-binding Xre family transcriptional regulator